MLGRALTHLYAKRSQQLGSWAGGQGGTPGGLVVPVPHCHFPPQAGPVRRAVRRPACVRIGCAEANTGPYRPYARGRKEKRTAGGRQREGDEGETMREKKKGRKPAASDSEWGRGAAAALLLAKAAQGRNRTGQRRAAR